MTPEKKLTKLKKTPKRNIKHKEQEKIDTDYKLRDELEKFQA